MTVSPTTATSSVALCAVDDIAERAAKSFEIGELNVFAVKFDGQLHVYRNSCPHLGVELNWLEDQFFDLDGELLQCATHGALFDPATGGCLAGPCRGQFLERVASHVEAGHLYLDAAPPSTR
jgi:nitrite reductase/ring-hydroxylating ferredoxin subunit